MRRCCSRMSTQAVPTCRVDEYPRRRWKVWPGERPPLPLAVCGRSHRLDGPPLGSHRPYGEVDYVLGQKDSISTNYHSGHSLSEWRDRNSSKMVEVSGLLVHGSRVEAQWRCHGNSWTEEWFPGTNTNLHHRGTPLNPIPRPHARALTHTSPTQPNPLRRPKPQAPHPSAGSVSHICFQVLPWHAMPRGIWTCNTTRTTVSRCSLPLTAGNLLFCSCSALPTNTS